jgi:hypothetical protein
MVDNCWELNEPNGVYRVITESAVPFEIIRVRQSERNWKGTHALLLFSIELYGRLEDLGTWAVRERKKEEEANLQRIKKLEDDLAKEAVLAKRHKEAAVRRVSERWHLRKKMAAQRSRGEDQLFFQFCEQVERPFREANPKLSETDLEWRLYTMFKNTPEWSSPGRVRSDT